MATLPTIRLGLKFILLSMVRKSELQDGVWDEVDFENAVWSIPKERMKRLRPHNVYRPGARHQQSYRSGVNLFNIHARYPKSWSH